jgi:hypothetical protein
VQFAGGRRRRGHNLSEELQEEFEDSDASANEDSSVAHASAHSDRRGSYKQRGAFAAAASAAASSRAHGKGKLPLRGAHSGGVPPGEDESESSEDEPSNDEDDAADNSGGNDSALSELSEMSENEDEQMDLFQDELDEYALVVSVDDDDADEWKPSTAVSSSSKHSRKFNRFLGSLRKISPLNAVQQFIVDEMDSKHPCSYNTKGIFDSFSSILDMRKSPTHPAHIMRFHRARCVNAHSCPSLSLCYDSAWLAC